MADQKEYSPREAGEKLIKAVKEKVDAFAAELERLRKREVRKERKLAKNAGCDLCPLCGNPDSPGSCKCTSLKKSVPAMPTAPAGMAKPAAPAMPTAAPKTPGMQPATPSTPVPGSHGKPAGMGKNELCATHGTDLAKCGADCGGMKKASDTWDPSKDEDAKVRGSVLSRMREKAGAKPTGERLPPKRSASNIRGADPETVKIPAKAFGKAEEEVPTVTKQPGIKPSCPHCKDFGAYEVGETHTCGSCKKKFRVEAPVKKEEKAPGAKLPPAKGGKVAEASDGSGGEVKKGKKLTKAVAPAAAEQALKNPTVAPTGRKVIPLADLAAVTPQSKRAAAPSLPGMTPEPGAPHPETAQTLKEIAQLRDAPRAQAPAPVAQRPGANTVANLRARLAQTQDMRAEASARGVTPVSQVNQELAGFKSVAHRNPSTPEQLLAGDKKAGGVGWLNNLITRARGVGNKTWEDLRGAGPASTGRLLTTSALRRSEALGKKAPEPTSAAQANTEIQGFRSIASNPTAMPGAVVPPHIAQVNRDLSHFRSLIGSCPFCKQGGHPGDCTE